MSGVAREHELEGWVLGLLSGTQEEPQQRLAGSPEAPASQTVREAAQGEILMTAGDLASAVDAFARAVELDPQLPLARAPYIYLTTEGSKRTKALEDLAHA